LAQQATTFTLSAWVQRPCSTTALFFVPRVIQGFWFGLSRHIVELVLCKLRDYALHTQPLLPIPIVVLYLAPHVPTLCSPTRVDLPAVPSNIRAHCTEAQHLRRLQPISLAGEIPTEMYICPPGLLPSNRRKDGSVPH
jgi:hypothetical protein